MRSLRSACLAVVFAGACNCGEERTIAATGVVECLHQSCTGGDAGNPCGNYDRPMVCVEQAVLESAFLDPAGAFKSCEAVCWSSCDDTCTDPNTSCEIVGVTKLCVPIVCGNGTTQPGEECDDGNTEDGDACTNACKSARCGDGIKGPDEQCDDGNVVDTDACLTSCQAASCGDGFIGPGEECDDKNDEEQDDCLSSCVKATCGDGITGPGEVCDDGNRIDIDSCTNECKPPARCGDKIVQDPEQCDDGNIDDGDTCTNRCTTARCGDTSVGPGEQCDDGNDDPSDACDACKTTFCGDGVKGANEQCDDGNEDETDACRTTCENARCGDGFQGPGEECDDGNEDPSDACNACKTTFCGDGVKGANEECDDGDDDDTDDCPTTCQAARCGDGFRRAGEICDDGDNNDTNACTNACVCRAGLYDPENTGNCAALPSCIVRVAVGGTGDGSTWATATGDLSAAVTKAGTLAQSRLDARCEVWVKAGKYLVFKASAGDTLTLGQGVRLVGGFAGTEDVATARAFEPLTGLTVARTIIDGETKVRHVLTASSDVLLDGVTITGGKAVGTWPAPITGAGLVAMGAEKLVIQRSVFMGNVADHGGAIAVTGGDLRIEKSYFTDNSVPRDGGALYAWKTRSITIDDSLFEQNNSSNGHGGSIATYEVPEFIARRTTLVLSDARWDGGAAAHIGGGTVSYEDSNFALNDTNLALLPRCLGGSLYARGTIQADIDTGLATTLHPMDSLRLVNTSFTGSNTIREGGAMYLSAIRSVVISGASVTGNLSSDPNPAFGITPDGGRGGAMAAYDLGELRIDESTFADNTAKYDGGAIYGERLGRITINRSEFRRNKSLLSDGGGVYLKGTTGPIEIWGTEFVGNQAWGYGGGLAVFDYPSFRLEDSTFTANTQQTGKGGGGIWLSGSEATSTVTVLDTLFDFNTANAMGGGLGVVKAKSVDIAVTRFFDNGYAARTDAVGRTLSGGALYLEYVNKVDVADARFKHNAAFNSGGAIFVKDVNDGAVRNSNLETNTSNAGGAIWVCSTRPQAVQRVECSSPYSNANPPSTVAYVSRLKLTGTALRGNVGGSLASAVYVKNTEKLEFTDSILEGNVASNFGAVLAESTDTVAVNATQFLANRGDRAGGAALTTRDSVSVTFDGAVFDSNVSAGQDPVGAAWVERAATVVVRSSTFRANVGGNAPALLLRENPVWSVIDSAFTANEGKGGALWAKSDGTRSTKGTLTNARFEGNKANQWGGAGFALRDVDLLTVTAVTAKANISSAPIGAGNIERIGTLLVSGSTFEGNTSTAVAGALLIRDIAKATLETTLFTGNSTTGGSGGAIQIDSGPGPNGAMPELTVRTSTFRGNSSAVVGGGLVLRNIVTAVVDDNAFDANVAGTQRDGSGAGFFGDSIDAISLSRNAFTGNVAGKTAATGYNGAAAAFDNGRGIVFSDNLFANNRIVSSGGVGRGGAILVKPWVNGSSTPLKLRVVGSTLVSNAAENSAAVEIHGGNEMPIEIVNSVVWGNTGARGVGYMSGNSDPANGGYDIKYSGSQDYANAVTRVIGTDPLFKTASVSDPFAAYRPGANSPLRDAGDPANRTERDLEKTTRGNPPDIGAFEVP